MNKEQLIKDITGIFVINERAQEKGIAAVCQYVINFLVDLKIPGALNWNGDALDTNYGVYLDSKNKPYCSVRNNNNEVKPNEIFMSYKEYKERFMDPHYNSLKEPQILQDYEIF